jgi:phosphatidylglycerol:prolipoprotein diacylglycerol transferase
MHPVLLQVGGMVLYSYGVMLALAFVACWLFARWYLRRQGLDGGIAVDLLLAAAAGGITGARGLYVATNWGVFAKNPLWIFQLQRGGMVFYGGLMGGALAVAAYVVLRKLPVPVIADGAAIAVPLGSAIGRIGCFLNGCCAGRPTGTLLGVVFPGTSAAVYPTQLIDSAANLLICAILLHVLVRVRPRPSTLWWGFVALYGVSRFLVEMLRTNPALALGLTQAQWISVPMVVSGAAGLAWMLRPGRDGVSGGSDE